MWKIVRYLEQEIKGALFTGKTLIVYGPRQVGKTTLVKKILEENKNGLYLNCDEIDIREALQDKTSTEIKGLLGNKTFIVIDEAQRVKNIGITIKLIYDSFPELQVIATGSSSFELANEINEPLTGRKKEFFMYPISFGELSLTYSNIELKRMLEQRMIYGMYPDILDSNVEDTIDNLKSLAGSYLFKDILNFGKIKKSDFLIKLLQALALQMGSEVSYNELSRLLGIDKKTVESYINILEQAYIIFKLSSFSRNVRSELKRSKKIYFYDNGIRNALINNFNPLHLRTDSGDLFENFIIVERLKYNATKNLHKNIFFWRTTTQKEIDFVEESHGEIHGFEFKLNSQKYKKHKEFLENYDKSTLKLINKDNFLDFVV